MNVTYGGTLSGCSSYGVILNLIEIFWGTNETNITFTLDGPKLKKAVPLLDVVVSLQEFHHIIDKAYLSTSNNKRISSSQFIR